MLPRVKRPFQEAVLQRPIEHFQSAERRIQLHRLMQRLLAANRNPVHLADDLTGFKAELLGRTARQHG